MQLSKEKIIEASVMILDDYGLADMTMRRIATQLGVAPGALYWHFKNKQALIDAVARTILASFLDLTNNSPKSFTQSALFLRELLLQHTDGADLVSAALADPQLWDDMVGVLSAALAAQNIDSKALQHSGAATALHFIIGATVLEQSQLQRLEIPHATVEPQEFTESETEPLNQRIKKLRSLDQAHDFFNKQFRTGLEIIESGLR